MGRKIALTTGNLNSLRLPNLFFFTTGFLLTQPPLRDSVRPHCLVPIHGSNIELVYSGEMPQDRVYRESRELTHKGTFIVQTVTDPTTRQQTAIEANQLDFARYAISNLTFTGISSQL